MEGGKQSEKIKDERERNGKRVPFNCSMEEEADSRTIIRKIVKSFAFRTD